MSKDGTYPKFEMENGKPESANVELLKFSTQPIEEELFPQELEALNILKQNKITKFFNDRFLMGCLFSRKMDIARTIKMLKSNLKWRLSNGYEKIPKWDEIDKNALDPGFAMTIPGARSKEGHSILYCRLGRLVPSELGKNYLKTVIEFIIWNNSIGTFLDGLDYHRNGLIFIADLTGVGWKNIDINLQRKVNSAMMDNFPLRIQKVFIINPPSIINAVLGVARVFVKKKIMDRIQIIQRDQLLDHIDADQLWTEFGGNVEYTVPDLVEAITERLKESPLRLHTITKNKNKKKKANKSGGKVDQIEIHNDEDQEKLKPKKKRTKKKDENVDLGVNVEEIPPDVLEQLKNNPDDNNDESDETTNSFLEKIDNQTSEEDSIRNSNSTKKKKEKTKN